MDNLTPEERDELLQAIMTVQCYTVVKRTIIGIVLFVAFVAVVVWVVV